MMKKIEKISGNNPFKVPENYFDELTGRILSSTVGNRTENENPGLLVKLRIFLAAAASMAVLALLTFTATRLFSPSEKSISLSQIIAEENSETIINEIDLLTLEENTSMPGFAEGEVPIDNDAIIDYLLLDNIDINIIYDQL